MPRKIAISYGILAAILIVLTLRPVPTGASSIEVPSTSGGANVYTSAHSIGPTDIGKIVVMNCSSACAVTFKATPAATDFWQVSSIGTTLATVNLNGLNFNGSATAPVLVINSVLQVSSDGSNYFGGIGGLEIGQTVGNGGRATSILYADSNGALTQDQFFTFRSGSSGLSGYFVVNPSDNAFQDLADFQQRNSSGLSSQIAVFNAFGGSQALRLGVNGNTASNCGGVANGNAYVCASGGVLNLGSGSSTLKLDSNKHQISAATAPTITSGFGGATGRSIAGTDDVIRVTLGNNGTDTQGVVAFQNSYTNIPVCTADEENLHTPLGVTPTTSQVTVFSAAAFVSADTVGIFCKAF